MGAFSKAAIEIREYGLTPVPVVITEDTKKPLVEHAKWKGAPSVRAYKKWMRQFPDAEIGILTGLSNVCVIDVDDRALVPEMDNRFGVSPLTVKTRRGQHSYYRLSGEASRIGLDGLDVDVKAVRGMVVVPPSGPYEFSRGDWSALKDLPRLNPGSLPQPIYKGKRNVSLFDYLRKTQVRRVDSLDDLIDVARTFNDDCLPPMSDAEVVKTAHSVWKMLIEDRIWDGGPAQVRFTGDEIDRLAQDPDKLVLLTVLRRSHGGRVEPFALDARAMNDHNVIGGWGRDRYMAVTKRLIASGDIDIVHKGGKRRGDPSLYRLRN